MSSKDSVIKTAPGGGDSYILVKKKDFMSMLFGGPSLNNSIVPATTSSSTVSSVLDPPADTKKYSSLAKFGLQISQGWSTNYTPEVKDAAGVRNDMKAHAERMKKAADLSACKSGRIADKAATARSTRVPSNPGSQSRAVSNGAISRNNSTMPPVSVRVVS